MVQNTDELLYPKSLKYTTITSQRDVKVCKLDHSASQNAISMPE